MNNPEPLPAAPAAVDPHACAAEAERPMGVRFTGSGSEYFRIWIVNTLLIVVTVGLYYPWARARKLSYFYANTCIGEHALSYHGRPGLMLRGYVLVAVLLVLFNRAGSFSPAAGLVALGLMAGLWPALFRSAQRFRMASTAWRGLRLGFDGDLPDAYRAWAVWTIVGMVYFGGDLMSTTASESALAFASSLPMLVNLTLLVGLLAAPYGYWRIKSYQHRHYRYATEATRFDASVGAVYRCGGPSVGGVFLLGFACAALSLMGTVGGVLALIAAVLGWQAIQARLKARLQNLVWSRTRSPSIRFESALDESELTLLTLQNAVKLLVTLGFYWPFAAVATTRMRLQAVTIFVQPSFDALTAQAQGAGAEASGDAATDLLGIDVGL